MNTPWAKFQKNLQSNRIFDTLSLSDFRSSRRNQFYQLQTILKKINERASILIKNGQIISNCINNINILDGFWLFQWISTFSIDFDFLDAFIDIMVVYFDLLTKNNLKMFQKWTNLIKKVSNGQKDHKLVEFNWILTSSFIRNRISMLEIESD